MSRSGKHWTVTSSTLTMILMGYNTVHTYDYQFPVAVAKSFIAICSLSQAFNCTSLGVGSEDFLPFDGFTSEDIFPYLADVNESFTTIDFREFAEKINESEFLSFDLTQLEANLTLVVVGIII